MDDGDAGDGLATILAAADAIEQRRGKPRTISWKTEWLVYCFFVHCNVSMIRIATLFVCVCVCVTWPSEEGDLCIMGLQAVTPQRFPPPWRLF